MSDYRRVAVDKLTYSYKVVDSYVGVFPPLQSEKINNSHAQSTLYSLFTVTFALLTRSG